MQKIREILLNEYIGAITIGLLLAHAVGVAINIVLKTVSFGLNKNSLSRSLFSNTEGTFPWASMVEPAIDLALYLLVIFALVYWLYLKETPEELSTEQEERSEEA